MTSGGPNTQWNDLLRLDIADSNPPSPTGKRMGMQPDTPRTFLFGQTLGHQRDGTDELRVPEFVCIENRHEHNAEVILVKFHVIISSGAVGRPAENKVICRQYQDDCMWPSCPRRSGQSSPRDAQLVERLVAQTKYGSRPEANTLTP